MRELDDFALVSDDDLRLAQWLLLSEAHTLSELAGAAALAALISRKDEFAGRKVGVVCSGANAGPAELQHVLSAGSSLTAGHG